MNIKFDFKLTEDRRKKVIEQIQGTCEADFGFYMMTGLSAIIVALGLLIDSSAVVIGGMLLAPIFQNTLGLALSVTQGKVNKFKFHLVTLGKAIAVAVILTILLFLIIPTNQEAGTEILSRGNPNILHLLIAIFSGVAGAIAMAWPGITTSIIGVLVAAALIPPLATISYGISFGDGSLAIGAFLLFIANLVAIVFAATVTFFVLGFKPHPSKEAKMFMQNDIKWTIILLVLVCLPLTYSFLKANEEQQDEEVVRDVMKKEIKNLELSDIQSIEIEEERDKFVIKSVILSDQNILPSKKEMLEGELGYWLEKDVDMELQVIYADKL